MTANVSMQALHERRLRNIEEERGGLEEELGACQADRDELIRDAASAGLTQAAIARATDLTRSRVGQIVGEK